MKTQTNVDPTDASQTPGALEALLKACVLPMRTVAAAQRKPLHSSFSLRTFYLKHS